MSKTAPATDFAREDILFDEGISSVKAVLVLLANWKFHRELYLRSVEVARFNDI